MARSLGTVYLGTHLFVEKRHGKEALERVLADMSAADREDLQGITAVGFYPLDPVLRFQRTADRMLGKGDLGLCREMGHFTADWQLNRFHKLILRMKRPSYLVERATSIWDRYHSCGTWEIAETTPTAFVGRLSEFDANDRAFCVRLEGWLIRAFELCGAKEIQVIETQCTTRGDAYCEFHGRWQ